MWLLALGLLGCERPAATEKDLAALEVSASRADLLFVWIDARGETVVETQAAAVPEAQRELVRVIDPQQAAVGDLVLVADLRQPGEGGRYATRVIPRREFDAVVNARRGAASGSAVAGPSEPTAAPTAQAVAAAQGRAPVIIYGAEWCGACNQAAAYMRRRGVPFVEKDIEQDRTARREMDAKLQASGQRSQSIPVLDVRGRILLGFSSNAVEAALGRGI